MRRRFWVLLIATTLAIVLGFIGRATEVEGLLVLAGFGWVVAIVLAISLLPWWRRVVPPVPPMPGLFVAPGEDERWCLACGTPAPAESACTVCGSTKA